MCLTKEAYKIDYQFCRPRNEDVDWQRHGWRLGLGGSGHVDCLSSDRSDGRHFSGSLPSRIPQAIFRRHQRYESPYFNFNQPSTHFRWGVTSLVLQCVIMVYLMGRFSEQNENECTYAWCDSQRAVLRSWLVNQVCD